MSTERFQVRRLTGGCGAELLDVDLSRELDTVQWETIRNAFHEHGVIFFREQTITPDQHLAFARRWGGIDINRFIQPVADYPEIAIVNKAEFDKTNVGGDWHTDHSYDQIPAMGSILVARTVPDEGGDTLFANMYGAYAALSAGLQETLQGMRAVHSAAHVFGPNGITKRDPNRSTPTHNAELADGEVSHPVVIRHPETGRPALYVTPIFPLRFEGWTPEESRPFLDYLYRQAVRPELICRFRWAPGSVAMWDNRATWHYAANDYHGHRRLMHRVTISGKQLAPFRATGTASASAA
jgi:taurine dioxygenase